MQLAALRQQIAPLALTDYGESTTGQIGATGRPPAASGTSEFTYYWAPMNGQVGATCRLLVASFTIDI